ncbi:hypothetical protein HF086_017827 [Spodoptera exigua]|uniref:Uncharacterized protein n=1 Tax=Spodoptera exigua TaxID=7107 RepID=A0A922M2S1_SPOEX|nr:hypothetical protein HF086_017827 [Spodoptera exigua]
MENDKFYNLNSITGESNVYTLGTIGNHRVVTTKLPSVGRTREAMTAAGNTTTRLLGIFQKTESDYLTDVAYTWDRVKYANFWKWKLFAFHFLMSSIITQKHCFGIFMTLGIGKNVNE